MRLRAIIPACALALLVAGADVCAELDLSIDQLLQEAAQIAAELPPTTPVPNAEMAKVIEHLRAKRYLECVEAARAIIRKRPDDMPARFVAANALIAMNRYDAARKLLEQMLDRFPLHPGLLNNLAWLYATASDPDVRRPDKAVELARRALVIAPDDYHVWSTISEAYFANRDFPRALRAAEEALRMARERNAETRQIIIYEQQVLKCRDAVTAFSIFD